MPRAQEDMSSVAVPAAAGLMLALDGLAAPVAVRSVAPDALLVADVLGAIDPPPADGLVPPRLHGRLLSDSGRRHLGELHPHSTGADGLWLQVSTDAARALLWDVLDNLAQAPAADPPTAPPPREGAAPTASAPLPVSNAGPLVFDGGTVQGSVVAPLATTDAALAAVTATGAQAITRAGAVCTRVLSRRAVRAPRFEFRDAATAARFGRFALAHREAIAQQEGAPPLVELDPVQSGRTLHLRFVYATAETAAADTAAWTAARWLLGVADAVPELGPDAFFLQDTAGLTAVRVLAECRLDGRTVLDVLHTTPQALVDAHRRAQDAARLTGTAPVAVAGVIAAVFSAAGRDLPRLPESAAAELELARDGEGVYAALLLPSLAVDDDRCAETTAGFALAHALAVRAACAAADAEPGGLPFSVRDVTPIIVLEGEPVANGRH